MNSDSCQGCARARNEDGFAVPGSPECLGCRRAFTHRPDLPDLWSGHPPGGADIRCDARGITFTSPLPDAFRYTLLLLACLVCAAWMLHYGGLLPGIVLGGLIGLGTRALRWRGVRHTWGVWDCRVWHIAALGALSIRRGYPAGAVRAFHCAGARADGPVCFHLGQWTVAVTHLPTAADNEWLMRELNARLARERRRIERSARAR
ncbi:MAG TPA: hypothetical protein PLU39_02740 [Armatimonadota bacterium]|jgi:hypothetical protein|nr:hypothetical protein [Armatimonadota bacterium]